jgi:hypothetical protein
LCSVGTATGGACTLRAAIAEANSVGGSDNIYFNIPTSDAGYRDYDTPDTASSGDSTGEDDYWTIRVSTSLPNLSQEIHIDGNTQESSSGFNRNLLGPDIEIRHATTFAGNLITFLAGATSSTINHLTINNFGSSGAHAGINSFASGLTITRLYIGTDVKGLVDKTSSSTLGIAVNGNLGNIIGNTVSDGNIIGGVAYGINFLNCTAGVTDYNYMRGNRVGLGSDGVTSVSNSNYGIVIGHHCRVEIGGDSDTHRNYISSNLGGGINPSGGTNTNEEFQILNNYFGTDITGTLSRPNGSSGDIRVQSGDNSGTSNRHRIGGVGKGNLFRFNPRSVWLNTSGADFKMTIENNTISDNTANRAILIDSAGNNTIVQNNAIGAFESDPYFGFETSGNLGRGIELRTGGSPVIRGNIINGSTNQGISLQNGSQDSRSSATTDVIGKPIIGGQNALTGSLCNGLEKNCIYNNAWGGIYSYDTMPANEATLWADNDFTGGNGLNGDNNIEQVWFGLFELHSSNYRRTDLTGLTVPFPSGTLVKTSTDPSSIVTSGAATNVTCLGSTGVSCPASGHTSGTLDNAYVVVPSGQGASVLSNSNNWFRITEYIYNGAGTKINYSSFKFDQPHLSSKLFTFDGNSSNNVINTATARTIDSLSYSDRGEPWADKPTATRNIATDSIGRFQIMEVEYVDANPVWVPNKGYVVTVDSGVDTTITSPTYFDDGGYLNTTAANSGGISKLSTTELPDGKTNLREAITLANAFASREFIEFNIPTSDPSWNTADFPNRFNLTFDSNLPNLTSAVIIDGTTQENATGDNYPSNYNIETPDEVTSGPELVLNFEETISGWIVSGATTNIWKLGFYNSRMDDRLLTISGLESSVLQSDFVNGNFGAARVSSTGGCMIEFQRNVFRDSVAQPVIEEQCASGGLQKVIGNFFINNQTDIAFVKTNTTNVQKVNVVNNYFLGSGVGIYANANRPIYIENNIFKDTVTPAINITSYQLSDRVKILGNVFEGTMNQSIDLSASTWDGDGITLNDTGDIDTGSNSFQNHSVIESIQYMGNGDYLVSGLVDGLDAEAPFTIEICESSNNVSGYGGCKDSLGYVLTSEVENVHRWEMIVNIEGSNGEDSRVFTTLATNKFDSTSEFSPNFFANLENPNYIIEKYDITLESPSPLANTNDTTPLFDWSTEFNGESIVEYPKYNSEVTTGANYSYDFKKDGNYLYIAHYAVITVVDVSDPTNLKVVASYGLDNASGANSRQIDIQDNLLFAISGTWGSILSIADISDPVNPQHVITIPSPGGGTPYSVQANGNYMYVKTNLGLLVYNITDPYNPILIKTVATSAATGFSNSIRIYGNYLYLTTNTNLEVLDISNPADPVNVKTISIGTTSSIEIEGNRLYMSLIVDSKLLVFDLSIPSHPELLTNFKYSDTNNSALTHLSISGNYVFIGKVGVGITMIDITDITNPVVLKNMQDGLNIFSSGVIVDGNILYSDNYDINTNAAGTATIRAIDIGADFPASIQDIVDPKLSGYEVYLNNTLYATIPNSTTQFQAISALNPGTYNWYVKAIWEDGNVAGISTTRQFIISQNPVTQDLTGTSEEIENVVQPVSYIEELTQGVSNPISEDINTSHGNPNAIVLALCLLIPSLGLGVFAFLRRRRS